MRVRDKNAEFLLRISVRQSHNCTPDLVRAEEQKENAQGYESIKELHIAFHYYYKSLRDEK